ncbi:uncharacterized protein LOC111406978 [Olea europaea var. sylvestris]|uniref:uncharacterized protein LOC111406978 n=1 Tax=Olea europaea var. sylvestris TaxID=158386 RepID=UPI000C1CF313|nr:uncharacterized protein LOC111406978 [Olea europaea var. sylvestris]
MYKWRPNKLLTEKTIKYFLTTREIQVISTLHHTEEELKTSWYINLSLSADNEHSVLDDIVRGELDNMARQIPDNTFEEERDNIYVPEMTIPSTSRTSPIAGPNYGSSASNYVTEDRTIELLDVQKQDIIKEVFDICGNLRTEVYDNQRRLFEQHQNWQEDYTQFSIRSYMDNSLSSFLNTHLEKEEQLFHQQKKNGKKIIIRPCTLM